MSPNRLAVLQQTAISLQKHITIPTNVNVGIGAQYQYRIIGPWIRIEPVNRKTGLRARHQVIFLLDSFYSKQHSKIGVSLVLRRLGTHGGFLIANHDSDIIDLLQAAQVKKIFAMHLQEFQRFGDYVSGIRDIPVPKKPVVPRSQS